MALSVASNWLSHPLTRGLSIDDPRTTELRRRIIRQKPFLRKIYVEWYQFIAAAIPEGSEPALELGSGAGFLDQFIPHLITSEVFLCPGVKMVLDGQSLPFCDASLRAIVMTDVLHHIRQPRSFLTEAARCVRPGGAVVAVEPWVTPWSRWVYTRFHHEPFEPGSADWEFPMRGPLSGANGAMPWIIFHRDRARFEREFPQWQIRSIRPFMPWRYLLSGGVSLRSLMPGFTFGFWRYLEWIADPWRDTLAMFAQISLLRRG
ncbi:MAG: methyltransferase domain-containing protein [Tepidisphaeraceae bacterium]